MQEIGVRSSNTGLLHHHVGHGHHHHHQLSSAHASVHTSDGTSTVTTASPDNRQSSGEEEGSSPCHSPIDLSSGTISNTEVPMIAAPPPTGSNGSSTMTAGLENHPAILNAKFAEFLMAQRQKDLNDTKPPSNDENQMSLICPKKRQRAEVESLHQTFVDIEEDDEGMTKLDEPKQPMMPLELLRARWEQKEGTLRADSPSAESAGGSSTGSGCHGENVVQGREVKKRRLDELLSKKFSVADSPPNSSASSSISPPPIVSSSTTPQGSAASPSVKKANRRKPSSPLSALSYTHPPTSAASLLAVRPPSELYAKSERPSPDQPHHHQLSQSSPVPRTSSKSPRREPTNYLQSSPIKQEEKEADLLRGQLLHLQTAALLSSAMASSGSPNGAGFPGLSSNPLLYYGYVQMLQQQQKIIEHLASQKHRQDDRRFSSPSTPSIESPKMQLMSPSRSQAFQHRSILSANETHNRHSPYSPSAFSPRLSSSSPPFTPTSGAHFMSQGDDGSLSPLGGDEPRRRAPRALTGRYVKTGTGASREVLQILRKKIEERLKLRELLGENSHLYFGALNKNKKSGTTKSKPQVANSSSISVNHKF